MCRNGIEIHEQSVPELNKERCLKPEPQKSKKYSTRLGGVAHNGFAMAMMLVTTEEYGDQENGEHFLLI